MAALERVKDRHGDSMLLMRNCHGRLNAPDFNTEGVNSISKLTMRADDVMICSYPKSGAHWMSEILRLCLQGMEALESKVIKEDGMLEMNTVDQLEKLESPRIMNTHGHFDEQPVEEIVSKGAKVVFIYRNLKSAATSYYFHHTRDPVYEYKSTFDRYLIRYLDGLVDGDNVFSYLKGWEDGILNTPGLNIHVLSYEDLKKNPMIELKRLSSFLGTSEDEDFLRKVHEATNFQSMQQRKTGVSHFVDNEGLPIMYRKGTIGDWKNHFSVAQSEMFDSIIEKELGKTKLFKFQYV